MSKLWDAKANEVSAEEYAAIEAEERLVYEAQKAVRKLLALREMKAAELADLLGVSPARVSQMLSAEAKNLTLRTLARIFHALGRRCVLGAEQEKLIEQAQELEENSQQKPVAPTEGTPGERANAQAKLDRWNEFADFDRVQELSDLAAFGKRSVWILPTGMEPANENELLRHDTADDEAARSWMGTALPYENAYEDGRVYA